MARRSCPADNSVMAAVVVLLALIALGAASAFGLTADSRDPRYGVGPVIMRRRRSHQEEICPGESCY